MAIRVCPLCQAEFLEFKTTCTHCGVALLDPDDDQDPRHLDEEEQVVYDLEAWPIDAQSDAAQVLAESGIPHAWDGTEVVMALIHEEAADRLFERVEREHGLDQPGAFGDPTDEGGDVKPGSETEYDLKEWPAQRRMELVEQLVERSVPHRWEGDLLVVATSFEDAVDGVLDAMEDPVDDDEDDDDAESAEPAEVLSGLFLSAERMKRNKVDVDTYAGLLGCIEEGDPERPPYGFDPKLWEQALELAEDLADAVAEDTDEIEPLAEQLFNLLRPYV